MNATDRFYDTTGASRFCGARGLHVAGTTLNKLRCVGGGPRFFRFGRKVAYSEQSLLEWLSGRVSSEVASTSAFAA
jgi:hypothetical protein